MKYLNFWKSQWRREWYQFRITSPQWKKVIIQPVFAKNMEEAVWNQKTLQLWKEMLLIQKIQLWLYRLLLKCIPSCYLVLHYFQAIFTLTGWLQSEIFPLCACRRNSCVRKHVAKEWEVLELGKKKKKKFVACLLTKTATTIFLWILMITVIETKQYFKADLIK